MYYDEEGEESQDKVGPPHPNGRLEWFFASYLGFETCSGSLQGQCFIFGALCPSKSGLMNKHIVKHIV